MFTRIVVEQVLAIVTVKFREDVRKDMQEELLEPGQPRMPPAINQYVYRPLL